jgi:hypothetical protein
VGELIEYIDRNLSKPEGDDLRLERRLLALVIRPDSPEVELLKLGPAKPITGWRRALAIMEHPNIAKVLDAGATENNHLSTKDAPAGSETTEPTHPPGHPIDFGKPTPTFGPVGQFAAILNRVHQGDRQAADELLPLVYEELRVLAAFKILLAEA